MVAHADGTLARTLKPWNGSMILEPPPSYALLDGGGTDRLAVVHMYAEFMDAILTYHVEDVSARMSLTRSLVMRHAPLSLCSLESRFWVAFKMSLLSMFEGAVRRFGKGALTWILIPEGKSQPVKSKPVRGAGRSHGSKSQPVKTTITGRPNGFFSFTAQAKRPAVKAPPRN